MAMNNGMYSSSTDEWSTPQWVFDYLDKEFHFTLDVCANSENHKCENYFTKEDDGLTKEWYGTVWMNPPYGKVIGQWVKKAYDFFVGGGTVVMLLPARTDTSWWHDYCTKGEVLFIKRRLRFGGSKNDAPFPSAIVIFDNRKDKWFSIM